MAAVRMKRRICLKRRKRRTRRMSNLGLSLSRRRSKAKNRQDHFVPYTNTLSRSSMAFPKHWVPFETNYRHVGFVPPPITSGSHLLMMIDMATGTYSVLPRVEEEENDQQAEKVERHILEAVEVCTGVSTEWVYHQHLRAASQAPLSSDSDADTTDEEEEASSDSDTSSDEEDVLQLPPEGSRKAKRKREERLSSPEEMDEEEIAEAFRQFQNDPLARLSTRPKRHPPPPAYYPTSPVVPPRSTRPIEEDGRKKQMAPHPIPSPRQLRSADLSLQSIYAERAWSNADDFVAMVQARGVDLAREGCPTNLPSISALRRNKKTKPAKLQQIEKATAEGQIVSVEAFLRQWFNAVKLKTKQTLLQHPS